MYNFAILNINTYYVEWSVEQILANSGYNDQQLKKVAEDMKIDLTKQIEAAKKLVRETDTSTATFTIPTVEYPLFLWSDNNYNGFIARSKKDHPTKWADVRTVKEVGKNTYEMTQYFKSFKLLDGQQVMFYALPKTALVVDTPAPADAKLVTKATEVSDISEWILKQQEIVNYIQFKKNPSVQYVMKVV